MSAGGTAGRACDWFVRRAGLARSTTIACAAGLSLAALAPSRPLPAVVGLALALTAVLVAQRPSLLRRSSTAGLGLLLVSVVLVGLFGGFLIGTVRLAGLLDSPLLSHVGEVVEADVVITGPVRSYAGWQSATAVVRRMAFVDEPRIVAGDARGDRLEAAGGLGEAAVRTSLPTASGEKVLLEVTPPDGDLPPVLAQGQLLTVRGELRAPKGPSASGFDEAKQLLHQGIQVVLRVAGESSGGADAAAPGDEPGLGQAGSHGADGKDLLRSGLLIRGQRGGVAGWFDRLRSSARAHLSLGPNLRVNEVLQGVVMGDTAGIDRGWMDAFRRAGTAHMLSVSGLHVASLAAIMIGLSSLLRLSRKVGFLLAAAAALLLIPLVGPSPPVVRAAAMIIIMLAGRLVGRRRDPWQGLAFAASLVLIPNPFAVFDVGFQLSFSAFAGMLALVRPIEQLLGRLPAAVRANLAVSIAATLGTAPVSLLVFGRTSLISPLANLMVVPTLPAVTGLGMASVLLGHAWRGFSMALDTLASLPMAWTILVSRLCAGAPVLDAGNLGRAVFAVALAALALPPGLALCGRGVPSPFGLRLPLFKRTLSWLRTHRPRDRRLGFSLGVACVLSGLLVGAAAYPVVAGGLRSVELLAGGRGWPAQVEVRVLDVGQGTAVLVRTPQHHALLFDGGPAGCHLTEQLRSLGVRRLDLVVISHPHADHFAGLLEGLDELEVGTFVDRTEVAPSPAAAREGATRLSAGSSSGEEEAGRYLELRRRLAEAGSRCLRAPPGSSLSIDGVAVVFFGPTRPQVLQDGGDPWGPGVAPPSGDELNGGSLVAVLQAGGIETLVPGDAEADSLERYRLPPVDMIVVPHHGSRGAVSERLLVALRPKLAVISVGRDNSFGQPDAGTLRLLREAGVTVVRTDESGWVSLRAEDTQMIVSAERTRAR